MSGVEVNIDGKELPQLKVKYSQNLGVLEGVSDLRIYRNSFNRSVVQDVGKQFFTITEYDTHARIKTVLVNIKAIDVYRFEFLFYKYLNFQNCLISKKYRHNFKVIQ